MWQLARQEGQAREELAGVKRVVALEEQGLLLRRAKLETIRRDTERHLRHKFTECAPHTPSSPPDNITQRFTVLLQGDNTLLCHALTYGKLSFGSFCMCHEHSTERMTAV